MYPDTDTDTVPNLVDTEGDTAPVLEDPDDVLDQAIGDKRSDPSDDLVDTALDTSLREALDANTDQGKIPAEERGGDREQAGEFPAAEEGREDEEQDEPGSDEG